MLMQPHRHRVVNWTTQHIRQRHVLTNRVAEERDRKAKMLLAGNVLNRHEILVRSGEQLKIVAIATGMTAWLFHQYILGCLVLVSAFIFFAARYWIYEVIIRRLGHEGAIIEDSLNNLMGEPLLFHENKFGGAIHGSFRVMPVDLQMRIGDRAQ